MTANLFEVASGAKIYDLSQPYFPGMPHYPTHPPFLYGLTKQHGEYVYPGGGSSSADSIALGTHVGTHIDALCHFSCDGKLHGCLGPQSLSIDTLPPIFRRGVLLDLAGSDPLPFDFEATPERLEAAAEGLEIRPGDIILLRTGWAQYFGNPAKYINEVKGPGPAIDGVRWLSARKPFAVGSDTVAFEKVPSPEMAGHVHLLVEKGIHIIEVLDLERLAADGVREFTFAGAPLKIQGATAAPIRPFALTL